MSTSLTRQRYNRTSTTANGDDREKGQTDSAEGWWWCSGEGVERWWRCSGEGVLPEAETDSRGTAGSTSYRNYSRYSRTQRRLSRPHSAGRQQNGADQRRFISNLGGCSAFPETGRSVREEWSAAAALGAGRVPAIHRRWRHPSYEYLPRVWIINPGNGRAVSITITSPCP